MNKYTNLFVSTTIYYAGLTATKYLLEKVNYGWILDGPTIPEGIWYDNILCMSIGLALCSKNFDIFSKGKEDEEKPPIVAKYTQQWHEENDVTHPQTPKIN